MGASQRSTLPKMNAEVSVRASANPCMTTGLLVVLCREKFLLGSVLRYPECSLEARYSAKESGKNTAAESGKLQTGAARAARAHSRLAGLAWSGAPFGVSAPPNPCQTEAGCCSIGLLLTGLCTADTGAVEGFSWPGSVSEASGVGAAREPLPWPASGRCGFPSLEGHAR
jgi:hypothetical protein